MIQTPGKSQSFQGSSPSTSPAILAEGVFSLCSGGTPIQGAFQRLPGKTIRDNGTLYGGAITIYQLGTKVVVQRFGGLQIYNMSEINPTLLDFYTTNYDEIYTDEYGLPYTT